MAAIRLDLNSPAFQKIWFGLEGQEMLAVLATFKKLISTDWNQLYNHSGLQWELIRSSEKQSGRKLYSLHVTKKCRATAYRDGDFLRMVDLHIDHDSAYH